MTGMWNSEPVVERITLGLSMVDAIVDEYHHVASGGVGGTDHGARVARVAHLPERGDAHALGATGGVLHFGVHACAEFVRLANGDDTLRIRADMVDHLARGGVHVQIGGSVDGTLRDVGEHVGVDAVLVTGHVDIGDDVGRVAYGFSHGLGAFDKEPAALAAALGAGEVRDSADSVGFRIVKQLSVDWHDFHPTARADISTPQSLGRLCRNPDGTILRESELSYRKNEEGAESPCHAQSSGTFASLLLHNGSPMKKVSTSEHRSRANVTFGEEIIKS